MPDRVQNILEKRLMASQLSSISAPDNHRFSKTKRR
jgi:hypothetical protein